VDFSLLFTLCLLWSKNRMTKNIILHKTRVTLLPKEFVCPCVTL
jgi:hypothetical protein